MIAFTLKDEKSVHSRAVTLKGVVNKVLSSNNFGVTVDKLKESLREAIPASLHSLQSLAGGERLAAFALCTDLDLATLCAAAYTPSHAENFSRPELAFLPANWPLEDKSDAMRQASRILWDWVHTQYDADPDGLEPWDDHRRPWKAETFRAIVDVLEELRNAPLLKDIPVWLTAHDMGAEMKRWIRDGVVRLNSEAMVEQWSATWKY